MLTIMGIAKTVTTCSACAAFYLHKKNTRQMSSVRNKMNEFFKKGRLFIPLGEYKKAYPRVQYISVEGAKTTVICTIPTGLDPDLFEKNRFMLEQQFGEELEIIREGKEITIEAYSTPLASFDYNYAEIAPHLSGMKLPIVAGKSRRGWIVYDMVKHPHLLVAGETGSGKSVQTRQIITTGMLTLSPDKLHFYFFDPMSVEYGMFKNIAHTKAYETKMDHIVKRIQKLREELARRGELLAKHGVMHIDDIPGEKIPYLMLCFDEFHLLKGQDEMVNLLQDIGSAGRKCGMFLLLTCLRPDAEVMKGGLKQTLTVRMVFRQPDELNSRISLGEECNDAAHISSKAKGRMIFKFDGYVPVQSPKLEPEETERLLERFVVEHVPETERENVIVIDRTQEEKPKKRRRKKKPQAEFTFME